MQRSQQPSSFVRIYKAFHLSRPFHCPRKWRGPRLLPFFRQGHHLRCSFPTCSANASCLEMLAVCAPSSWLLPQTFTSLLSVQALPIRQRAASFPPLPKTAPAFTDTPSARLEAEIQSLLLPTIDHPPHPPACLSI